MSPRPNVPLPLRVAARILPEDTREEVLGDLVEAWTRRVAAGGAARGLAWAWRQPLVALAIRARSHDDPEDDARIRLRRGRLGRVSRGPGFSWLDVKLGVRMLGKQPVLTLVAGLTLALGVPAALVPTHVLTVFDSSFPVEDGRRIVGIRNWDLETGRPVFRSLHDFSVWRKDLRSFQTVGAARSDPWNVHSPDGRAAEVRGAEVTASVFRMLRVPPLLGRTLIDADEVEGAPDVVVISEDLWTSRFARDPGIVGTVIGIGRRPHAVVGVMPEGFLFPIMDHLWLPLRADPNDYAVGAGPDLLVFGRLADGVSAEEASTELETVGARLRSEWRETHELLRAEVVSVPLMAFGEPAAGLALSWEMMLLQVFCFTLLAVACGNVGILVLARTATRMDEMAVRTALGASRTRILTQLFIESLVLAVVATGAGLALADSLVVRFAEMVLDGEIPYWFDLSVGPRSVVIALGLAAVCAVGAGVLPALKATRADIQRSLQRQAAGNSVRFGPMTTLLVVAEVALSVGFLCFGTAAMLSFIGPRQEAQTIDVDRYLLAQLRTPWVEPTEDAAATYRAEFLTRVGQNNEELLDRLGADGRVGRVGMGVHVPGVPHPDRTIIVDGDEQGDGGRMARVVMGRVHVDYFRDMRIEVLSGRGFSSADVEGAEGEHRPTVVVNDQFVAEVFGGGDPIGRRVRYASRRPGETGESYEIVGVVETVGTNILNEERGAAMFHPLGASDAHPMLFVIEVAGDPVGFVPALREIAAQVDPDAMIQSPATLTEVVERIQLEYRMVTLFIFVLSAMGMILAATGLYALMSFTVAQRTREIGIRTALGAGARAVVAMIARRAALQLIAGVALGSVLGWWMLTQVVGSSEFRVNSVPGLLAAVALGVIGFSTVACLAPTLRGLRIQPTEALREG